eukprot:220715_1
MSFKPNKKRKANLNLNDETNSPPLKKVKLMKETDNLSQNKDRLTTAGYIRRITKDIPSKIIDLCVLYGSFDILKFMYFPSKFATVTENGTRCLSLGGHKSCCFVSSFGWKEGIHSFKIKINKFNFRRDFGVVTNNKNAINPSRNLFELGSNAYYDGYDGLIIVNSIPVKQSLPLLNERDIIEVIVNCNEWTIEFHVNSKFIAKTQLKHKNKTYFPAIGIETVTEGDHDYKLL